MRRTPVLLATAIVNIISRAGECHPVRALLDQGSEVSFVSESIVQLMKLPRRHASIPILGIGAQRSSVSNGIASLTISSRINSDLSYHIDALILPKLTAYLPAARFEPHNWPHIHGLQLADSNFAIPSKVDVVLGANVYARILEEGIRRGKEGEPIAQRTTLGWVLSGPIDQETPNNFSSYTSAIGLQCAVDSELLDLLQRFWTQEEVVPQSPTSLTPEEAMCEQHFETHHSRDTDGRFVVRLPLRTQISDFSNSRTPALTSLLRMEKRFESNPSLKTAYTEFLKEYEELEHMRPVSDFAPSREFFLPHHDVVRKTSSTSKLRVVFNGSQRTNLGCSLNEHLHAGPKLQNEIIDIIIRWRRHQFVFAADIEKMYRQIRVHEEDWPLQKILWRTSPSDEPREYLCTVTYGLACAPYLALRCIQQLSADAETTLPLAAEILRHDIYVDDILSGAADISQANSQIHQLREALTAGGFRLRKWIANDATLLADIPDRDRAQSSSVPFTADAIHNTLGISWEQHQDNFTFSLPTNANINKSATKRSVLSSIARMFDPLGWIAPVIVRSKIFMQELWAIRLDWDDELPEPFKSRWQNLLDQFEDAAALSIPRWFGTTTSNLAIEIHGFADASQGALAAAVYLRVLNDIDDLHVCLVSAKTKVAPLKRMSIPRLELSAAVLLVCHVRKINDTLNVLHAPVHLWTDSTVALAWIKSHPSRWKDFVRNRVAFIQELPNSTWRHVSSKDNPADREEYRLSVSKQSKFGGRGRTGYANTLQRGLLRLRILIDKP